jgi:hypothetical protein
MYVEFWLEKLQERDCLENTVMNERTIFKWIFKEYDQGRGMFIRARTRTLCCGNFLELFDFPRCEKSIDLAEESVASYKYLCCME